MLTEIPAPGSAAPVLDRHSALVVALTDPTFTTEALDPEHTEDIDDQPISLGRRIGTFLAVTLPPIGLVAAIILLWGVAISWIHVALLVGGHLLTGLGITVGYHRLFTHKSFDAHPIVKAFFGIAGSMALEGPILFWVATHRLHHQHSDRAMDPHSPHVRQDAAHGEIVRTGLIGRLRGAIHAHVGWLFKPEQPQSVMDKYIPDLLADKFVVRLSNLFLLWVAIGLVLPGLIAWAVTGTITGGLLGVLWGGVVRVFVVHHVTWSVNSVCHLWGTSPFRTGDQSRNNPIVGVLTLGEGWHNNHHAFPNWARHGLRWWELDISYLIVRALKLVGLAWNIKLPDPQRMADKRRRD